jgi:molybdenum cofactor cytidylyltransferase
MRTVTIPVEHGAGRALCSTIFRATGRKLLPKGHLLGEEDVKMLLREGLIEIWVTELDPGELLEDPAVWEAAQACTSGAIELKAVAGGRVNVFATEPGALIIDTDALRQVNLSETITIATAAPFSLVAAGERIASIKGRPFAIPAVEFAHVLQQLHAGVIRVRPIRQARAGVLMTDPLQPDRAVEQFWHVIRQRLDTIPGTSCFYAKSVEEDSALVRSLLHLRNGKPTVILIASTTAPSGPEDAVGRAILTVGGRIERFLVPVEPGNLGLLAYWDGVPVLSAPGCFRSGKPNFLNFVLPPLLAGHPVSSKEIAGMGVGGLLGN